MSAAVRLVVLDDASLDSFLRSALRALLDAAFNGEFDDHDWDHGCGGARVVAMEGDDPVAHASVAPRALVVGERRYRAGYLEAVATRPDRQHLGIGTQVVAEANRLVRDGFELGGLATGEHRFYERLGWERWRGPTFVVEPGGQAARAGEASPEDGDAVMVLRFGATAALDLALPIACERRAGDSW